MAERREMERPGSDSWMRLLVWGGASDVLGDPSAGAGYRVLAQTDEAAGARELRVRARVRVGGHTWICARASMAFRIETGYASSRTLKTASSTTSSNSRIGGDAGECLGISNSITNKPDTGVCQLT